jgi:hypothetical protein
VLDAIFDAKIRKWVYDEFQVEISVDVYVPGSLTEAKHADDHPTSGLTAQCNALR